MTTPAGGIFWRARIFEEFGVALMPDLDFIPAGQSVASLPFSISPTIDMVGGGNCQAAMDLSNGIELGFRGGLNPFEMELSPSLDFDGICYNQYTSINLGLTPSLSIAGTEQYSRVFNVHPTISMSNDATAPKNCTTAAAGGGGQYVNAVSYNQNIIGNVALVFIHIHAVGGSYGINSVKIGGEDAEYMASVYYYGAVNNYWTIYIYKFEDPPQGNKTVEVNMQGYQYTNVGSLCFKDIVNVHDAEMTYQYTYYPTHTVSSSTDETIAHAFFAAAWGGLAEYDQTARLDIGATDPAMIIGGAAGASSVTFNDSYASGNVWASYAIRMDL